MGYPFLRSGKTDDPALLPLYLYQLGPSKCLSWLRLRADPSHVTRRPLRPGASHVKLAGSRPNSRDVHVLRRIIFR